MSAEHRLWWTLISRAAQASIPLARALAVAWTTGARLVPAPDRGYTLQPVFGPGGWQEEEWQQFRAKCLAPYRGVLQRLLATLESDTDPNVGGPTHRDTALWQLRISQTLAGGPPTGQSVFKDGKAAWDEYHRRVAAGDLYCPKPSRYVAADDREFWMIPASETSTREMVAAAIRSEQRWAAYQAGPPAGMWYPVFVLSEGRWVEWDARWKGRRPEKGEWVPCLPVQGARRQG